MWIYLVPFGADTIIENGRCQVISLPWVFQIFQNAAGDAGATGWWAAALVMALLFLDKDFRSKPGKLLDALAESGDNYINTLSNVFSSHSD
ncbi:MAG: hypothetical protein CM15mP81_16860 [Alphaproteobacteria bacterium]|nr:MAG: hypothetical protein CM15mP81_16860 [Alphaproteobacteria bacterium]